MKKRNQKKINENFKGMKQRKDRNGKEQRLIFEKEILKNSLFDDFKEIILKVTKKSRNLQRINAFKKS